MLENPSTNAARDVGEMSPVVDTHNQKEPDTQEIPARTASSSG